MKPGQPVEAAVGPPPDDAGAEALSAPAWADAAWAAALLAVDPRGLGGVVVRAGAGPVRDRWARDLAALLPPAEPLRRMPGSIADERLLGGLDLAATLNLGRPVAQRGLLAECDGGIVVVPMAERLQPGTAARLCAALDSGEIAFERDGIGTRWAARVGVVAYDEATPDDAPLPAALADRLAFVVDLRASGLRDCGERAADAAAVLEARAKLPQVTVDEALLRALCGTALQLGVDSLRAGVLALRATCAAAALAGRREATQDDALLAARLVLGPRATRLPAPPPDDDAEPPPEEPPPPEPPADPPETPPADPTDAKRPEPEDQALEDRLIEATVASLPAGLLASLIDSRGGSQGGRVGALTASPRSGRPVGTRRGEPRGGARLNLIETLRAAAPWQRIRRAAAGVAGAAPVASLASAAGAARSAGAGRGAPGLQPMRANRIHVHADDLRVSRLQQRAATATLFVVDASGSSALHRLAEAKGAVNLLLADCYVRRDQVAVIAFRGRGAELLLPPTRSLVRAKRSLAALPGGGGTPLAAGLEAALKLALQVRRAGATPIVVLLTDGRGNIARDGEPGRVRAEQDALAMARQLRAARLTTLLVDTSPKPAAAAQQLAQALDAQYRALPHAGAAALSAAVQALPRGAR